MSLYILRRKAVFAILLSFAVVLVITAIVINPVRVSAGSRVQVDEVVAKQHAVELLNMLATLPDQRAAMRGGVVVNAIQNESLKRRTAEMEIKRFALRLKLGFPEGNALQGRVNWRDTLKALRLLNEQLQDFPAGTNNPGIGMLEEMIRMYKLR